MTAQPQQTLSEARLWEARPRGDSRKFEKSIAAGARFPHGDFDELL
jgi:hypothetical protein